MLVTGLHCAWDTVAVVNTRGGWLWDHTLCLQLPAVSVGRFRLLMACANDGFCGTILWDHDFVSEQPQCTQS